jgi:calcium-translocating P-type ATPase
MDLTQRGLTPTEVAKSREKYGTNVLTPPIFETFWDKLKGNFEDPMIIILSIALAIVIGLSLFGYAEWYEAVGIAVAVALATLISTASEYKNEHDLVVNDIVWLKTGDMAPADGHIIQGEVKINQASLTGEAEPTKKVVGTSECNDLNDKHAVFRGTVIEDGEAFMRVISVGDNTKMGQLVVELKVNDREGPLKVKLSKLADQIAMFGYIGGSTIAAAFIFKSICLDNNFDKTSMIAYVMNWGQFASDIVTAIILAVIIIVVAVPEGLPMMIAIVLAGNMRKLLDEKVLVRRLIGIETAGSLNILFSDKTGTITEGKLKATNFIVLIKDSDSSYDKVYDSFNSMPKDTAALLDVSLRYNTNCVINPHAHKEEEKILGGNTTERALLRFINADKSKAVSRDDVKIIEQVSFSSVRKFSLACIKQKGKYLTLVKGAPEIMLENCSTIWVEDKSEEKTAEKQNKLLELINHKSGKGYRVIGIATKNEKYKDGEKLPEEMELLGFVLIRDNIRQEAKEAIGLLKKAGIHVVMITGDRKETAVPIAKESGIIDGSNIILASDELKSLSDNQVKEIIPKLAVVARCQPTDKSRLVRLAQDINLVVGMTGDGVNDSPALKRADIGFGMGSGTEVAKEASDIVILDDNIQSITNAVHYGRTIYRSIQRFITFQLTVNISAILIAFIGPFLGFELPLTMIQLLWVNLVMDTLAALAFSGEPALQEYMGERPKDREENIINRNMTVSILWNGLFITFVSVVFLSWDYILKSVFDNNNLVFLTVFFAIFIFLNNFNKFNVRVDNKEIFNHIGKNKNFIKVVGMIFVVQIIMTYIGGEVFRTVPIGLYEWIIILGISFLVIPWDMIRKTLVVRKNSSDL